MLVNVLANAVLTTGSILRIWYRVTTVESALDLLLQQPVAALEFAQFLGLLGRDARLDAVLDIGLTDPRVQGGLVDPEVLRDLLQRSLRVPVPGDTNNVVTELAGTGLGHSDILSSLPVRQARPVVTYPCSRPQGVPRTRLSRCRPAVSTSSCVVSRSTNRTVAGRSSRVPRAGGDLVVCADGDGSRRVM
jgi:hypothetical protein